MAGGRSQWGVKDEWLRRISRSERFGHFVGVLVAMARQVLIKWLIGADQLSDKSWSSG